jgi:predicted component of type VI protein secretion system
MKAFREEIFALRDRLEKAVVNGSPVERQTLHYLSLLAEADDTALARGLADLEQFWLSSIDWCSELSKQIEKVIIMYEDLRDLPVPENKLES